MTAPEPTRPADEHTDAVALDLDAIHETICDNFTGMAEVQQAADLLVAEVRRLAALCIPLTDLAQELDLSRQNLHHSRAMSSAHFERAEREKARAESAEAEVVTLRARLAAVEALHWEVEGKCAHCRDCYHDDYLAWPCPTAAALASSPTPSETGEGEHVAREVFTADGIPFVRCSCTNAKSPTSHRWLSEHVPNGGVAELQAVVKRQAEGAKA